MIREVNTLVQMQETVRDLTGALVNTATLALSVTKPDGTITVPSVTNTGAGGLYTAPITPDQVGLWRYTWTASGTIVSVRSDQFSVVAAQRALCASKEEFKRQLRRTGVTDVLDDEDLQTYLVSATDWVENVIGGPLSVMTFTERHPVGGFALIPNNRPLVTVTSLTPDFGTAVDASFYQVDTTRNMIRFYWAIQRGWYTLVYRAGQTALAERNKLGGLIVATHLWRVQNGSAGRGYAGTDDLVVSAGFAVPRRAAELLAQDNIPGFA